MPFVLRGLRRQVYKRVAVPRASGGVYHQNEPDGHELIDYELDVDLPGLVRMYAEDAAKNKSGSAKRCHGLVKLRVIKRERVPA